MVPHQGDGVQVRRPRGELAFPVGERGERDYQQVRPRYALRAVCRNESTLSDFEVSASPWSRITSSALFWAPFRSHGQTMANHLTVATRRHDPERAYCDACARKARSIHFIEIQKEDSRVCQRHGIRAQGLVRAGPAAGTSEGTGPPALRAGTLKFLVHMVLVLGAL